MMPDAQVRATTTRTTAHCAAQQALALSPSLPSKDGASAPAHRCCCCCCLNNLPCLIALCIADVPGREAASVTCCIGPP